MGANVRGPKDALAAGGLPQPSDWVPSAGAALAVS